MAPCGINPLGARAEKFFGKGIDKSEFVCYNVYCEVSDMYQCDKCFHQYCVSNDSLASCNVCENGDMFSPIEESEEKENGNDCND